MRTTWLTASWLATFCLVPGSAAAQETNDPSASLADDFDDAGETPSAWQPLSDLRIRGEHVAGLPNGRADLERLRLRARLGAIWDRGGMWAAGAALRASVGDDFNRDNVRNNDNERSNDVDLDQAWLRWRIDENTRLEVGKAPLALALTSMVWDADLRPAGVALMHSRAVGDVDRLQWNIGVFDVDHPLAKGPRMYAAQLGWHWHEGAPLAFSAIATHLVFEHIDPLARAGLGRGNPVQGALQNARYRDGYRLVDVQFALRRNAGDQGMPLEARIDLLRNLAAAQARDAARFGLAWGDAQQPRGWEISYAYQRIQAAATFAAVNSDDWWFHAGARGHGLSLGYGFDAVWSTRLSGFSEVRDGLAQHNNRVLLDVIARW